MDLLKQFNIIKALTLSKLFSIIKSCLLKCIKIEHFTYFEVDERDLLHVKHSYQKGWFM